MASGRIREVFACGTAAVIAPIGELKGKGFSVGDINAPTGEVTLSIRNELTEAGLQLHITAITLGQHPALVAHGQQQVQAEEGQGGHAGHAQAPVGPPLVPGALPGRADHGSTSPLGSLKTSCMPVGNGVALASARSGWPA